MKSREELIRAALAIVQGDGGSGQAPDPEDEQFVSARVEPCLSSLSSRRIYPYGDPDQIEEDAFEDLSVCLANMATIANRFGTQRDAVAVREAENRLREITAETLSYQPAKGQYF